MKNHPPLKRGATCNRDAIYFRDFVESNTVGMIEYEVSVIAHQPWKQKVSNPNSCNAD